MNFFSLIIGCIQCSYNTIPVVEISDIYILKDMFINFNSKKYNNTYNKIFLYKYNQTNYFLNFVNTLINIGSKTDYCSFYKNADNLVVDKIYQNGILFYGNMLPLKNYICESCYNKIKSFNNKKLYQMPIDILNKKGEHLFNKLFSYEINTKMKKCHKYNAWLLTYLIKFILYNSYMESNQNTEFFRFFLNTLTMDNDITLPSTEIYWRIKELYIYSDIFSSKDIDIEKFIIRKQIPNTFEQIKTTYTSNNEQYYKLNKEISKELYDMIYCFTFRIHLKTYHEISMHINKSITPKDYFNIAYFVQKKKMEYPLINDKNLSYVKQLFKKAYVYTLYGKKIFYNELFQLFYNNYHYILNEVEKYQLIFDIVKIYITIFNNYLNIQNKLHEMNIVEPTIDCLPENLKYDYFFILDENYNFMVVDSEYIVMYINIVKIYKLTIFSIKKYILVHITKIKKLIDLIESNKQFDKVFLSTVISSKGSYLSIIHKNIEFKNAVIINNKTIKLNDYIAEIFKKPMFLSSINKNIHSDLSFNIINEKFSLNLKYNMLEICNNLTKQNCVSILVCCFLIISALVIILDKILSSKYCKPVNFYKNYYN